MWSCLNWRVWLDDLVVFFLVAVTVVVETLTGVAAVALLGWIFSDQLLLTAKTASAAVWDFAATAADTVRLLAGTAA